MENTKKMILLDENEFYKKQRDFVEKALKLAKAKAYNENLNLIVDNKVMENTNVIDYIINNKEFKFSKQFNEIIGEQKNILYTDKSPNSYKRDKNNKTNWISV